MKTTSFRRLLAPLALTLPMSLVLAVGGCAEKPTAGTPSTATSGEKQTNLPKETPPGKQGAKIDFQ